MKRGSTKVRSFRLLWLVTIGALVLTTASCELLYKLLNQPPEAGFTVGPSTVGSVPFAVTVSAATSYDKDENIESYTWNFGDGATGAGAAASHTYTAIGTYTIVLTVTDKYGAADTATKVVYVLAAETGPVASFTASPTSGTSPLTVSFDASDSTYTDGTIQSYSWNFGDGRTGSGMITSHTYSTTTGKTYTVTLTIRGVDGETDTDSRTITVSVSGGGTSTSGAPSARFDIQTDSYGVAPFQVAFDPSDSEAASGRIIESYHWSFGSGADLNATTTLSPTKQVRTYITDEASEVFSITLIVVDDASKNNSMTKTIRVENYQPTAGFQVYNKLNAGTPPAGGAWWCDDEDGEDDDRVLFTLVSVGAQVVSIRARQIVDPLWLNKDRDDPQPTTESGHPAEFLDGDGATMSFDPEGQTWEAAGPPDWFPNRAWGIERLSVNWGDGATNNYAFQDAADTVMQHTYDFVGGVKSWTITLTAYDYLGGDDSFQRTITFNVGG